MIWGVLRERIGDVRMGGRFPTVLDLFKHDVDAHAIHQLLPQLVEVLTPGISRVHS